jgi:diguanylate cyclase (GGDEF)-like protein
MASPPAQMTASSSLEDARLWKDLRAVAYALVTSDGRLIEANKGFELLMPVALQGKAGVDVRACFINPDFTRLVAEHSAGLTRKSFTVGIGEGKTVNLSGWFLPHEKDFLFLAEHATAAAAKSAEAAPADTSKELARLRRELLSANRRLKVREEQLREHSLTDALTGAANKRRITEAIEVGISHATRHKRPLSVVMADIDDFKAINDDFGHDAGDRTLRAFAELLKQHSRKSDLVARVGGEEFVVLMPECDIHQAKVSAMRMRAEVELMRVPSVDRPVTASFGVTQSIEEDTASFLLARAESAMVQAKAKGRNRVEAKEG